MANTLVVMSALVVSPESQMANTLQESIVASFHSFAHAIQSMPAAIAESWSALLPALVRANNDANRILLQQVQAQLPRPTTFIQNNSDRRRVVLNISKARGSEPPASITAGTAPTKEHLAVVHRHRPNVVEVSDDVSVDNRSDARAATTTQQSHTSVGEMTPGATYRVAFKAAAHGAVQIVEGVYNEGKLADGGGKLHDVATAIWTELVDGAEVATAKRPRPTPLDRL